MELAQSLALIREVRDFPKPGINFFDITPLLASPEGFATIVDTFKDLDPGAEIFVGIEARGFILASALAGAVKKGFVPIRKAGKLPFATISQRYSLEYGEDCLEIHTDALKAGDKTLIIDDVLATGGTIAAAIALVRATGADVENVAVLIELTALGGREYLQKIYPEINLFAVLQV
ncbi:MAG: adenine phosphoribosyltransferase [Actinobacteria bacterium]|uniref:adenine phosphoribosyltransferase n=1 Tax=freshwater metagenome TaxID=449393 RepID=A0A6J7GXF4_9ZZZZ|nr:adenine phosphoribosyltransferase [Actinomycetota bacterium]MSX24543.1 adenine phosphoribosyltransferase [Actinomycetota bacterium]MTB00227.1 adenine phosphoribosyltransferase [Actinomycetota bacterium]